MDNSDNNKIKNFNKEVIKSPMLKLVILSKEKRDEVIDFVKKVVFEKTKEDHHKIDSGQEEKRWYTGFCGEVALGEFLGEDFVDLTIGDSKGYHVSDLSNLGLDIGVKTVEKGKFPIIFKNNKTPQIIIIKESDSRFTISGLATTDVLNKYQSDDLILSPALRKRGTKTGFYGFEKLLNFESISDLKMMTKHFSNGTKITDENGEYEIYYKDNRYLLQTSDKNPIGSYSLYSINKKLKGMLRDSEGNFKNK